MRAERPSPDPEEHVRTLARSLWWGVERGTRLLSPLVQAPNREYVPPIDVRHVASHMIAMSFLSIADHARTLATVLADPELGPSSATLARGALESFARIRFIAIGRTETEVQGRALKVLHVDVRDSAHGTEFAATDGDMTRAEYLAAVKKLIAGLEADVPDWSVSRAIRELAREVWSREEDIDEWIPYSQLSSVAHGTLPGLGSLVDDHGRLTLPRQEIINHIGVVYAVADRAVSALDVCPLPLLRDGAVQDVWVPIIVALDDTFQELRTYDTGDLPRRPPG